MQHKSNRCAPQMADHGKMCVTPACCSSYYILVHKRVNLTTEVIS